MNESQSNLEKFYNLVKGKNAQGTPACDTYISFLSIKEPCVIMVLTHKDNSDLYISGTKSMISILGDSVFHSNSTNFQYKNGTLTFLNKNKKTVTLQS